MRSQQPTQTVEDEQARPDTAALTAARELLPLIRGLRQETEARRRLADPIVERLRSTRLCRLSLSRDLHGLELALPDALAVYETLARAEAAVSWIVWNSSFTCFFGRSLCAAARGEVFRDPAWLYGSSSRPTGRAVVGRDGYRVDGRWSLVSGCELAEWLLLLCVVEEHGQPRMAASGEPEVRFVFVRRGDYEILDTWHAGGLRGTGSHDVVIQGCTVPEARTLSPFGPSELGGPLGRIPIICTMVAGFGAQCLGVGQAAVDAVVELARTKVSPDSGQELRERPEVLAAIARCAAGLDAARAHLRARADELWRAARSGAPAALEAISALWAAGHHAADAARAAVDAMYAAGGASSLYTGCPLERAHRDLHAMLRHVVVQPVWLEDAGRVRLGAAPAHPLYAV
jgi:alkylation response protein AidB-like acyl-CoA dehydrogenase